MTKFAESLWIVDQDQSVFGLELGTRMTIIDLGGGQLFVHSPVRPTPSIVSTLKKMGSVTYVVAPNKWHHLYLNEFRQAFPQAKFFCAPGLETKRADFRFDGIIGVEQHQPWNSHLAHLIVEGAPFYNEVAFCHFKSRTLLLTDLATHICESKSWRTRFWLRLLGSYGRFGWSSLEKKMFIKDSENFHKSLRTILDWDFEGIVLAHGTPVTSGGKELLTQSFH